MTSRTLPASIATPTAAAAAFATGGKRDHRIDVIRGLALLMIFVDHVPHNDLNLVTLHSFGFCDAAEVFVLLAGYSSMLAYGKALDRDWFQGVRRILMRCLRIYLTHIGLVLATVLIGVRWAVHHPEVFPAIAPLLAIGPNAPFLVATLRALPEYLDILPLYVLLLAAFPLLHFAMRRHAGWTVFGASLVWGLAQFSPWLTLPNATDPKGWYFNPFTWQMLFVIGAGLATVTAKFPRRLLPRSSWVLAGCAAFLAFAALQTIPWHEWGLPSLRPLAMATPDKSSVAPLRIADIVILAYLLLSGRTFATINHPATAWLARCGRHSLEVFAAGCILALFGRLAFLTYGSGMLMEIAVNVAGFAAMGLVASAMEPRAGAPVADAPSSYPAASAMIE